MAVRAVRRKVFPLYFYVPMVWLLLGCREAARLNDRDRQRIPNDESSNDTTLDDSFDDELDDTLDDESFYDTTLDELEKTSGEITHPNDVKDLFVGSFEPDWVDDGQTGGDDAQQPGDDPSDVPGNTADKESSLWLDSQLTKDWEADRKGMAANDYGDSDVGFDVDDGDDCVQPFCGFSEPLIDGDCVGPLDRRDDDFFTGFGLIQDDVPWGADDGDAEMMRDDVLGVDAGILPIDVPAAALSQTPWKQVDRVLHEPVRAIWVGQTSVIAAGHGAVLLDATDRDELALPCRVRERIPACHLAHSFFGGISSAAEHSAFVAAAPLNDRAPTHVVLATGHHVLEWQDGALCKVGTFVTNEPGDSVRHVVFNACGGVSYALTRRGALLVSVNHARVWKQMKGLGRAIALGVDDNRLPHVLVQTPDSLRWYHADDDEHWESSSIMLAAPTQVLCVSRKLRASICAHGDCRALVFENGFLQLSNDAGETWHFGRVSPDVRAVALVPDAAALCQDRQRDRREAILVGAVVNEFQNRSYLFGWSGGDEPLLLADLSGVAKRGAESPRRGAESPRRGARDDSSIRNGDEMHDDLWQDVFELVWDQWRGCLWVGAAAGLSCWRPVSTS